MVLFFSGAANIVNKEPHEPHVAVPAPTNTPTTNVRKARKRGMNTYQQHLLKMMAAENKENLEVIRLKQEYYRAKISFLNEKRQRFLNRE